jgi:hypothetical protein
MQEEYTIENMHMGQTLYDFVKEQLKDVDTEELSDDVSDEVEINVDPGKVYFWTRVYLREKDPNLTVGDNIVLKYTPSGEELKTQFICYGKQGLDRDHDGEVTNYNQEDDEKIVCLMVEEKVINESEDIPFIRTLFKLGRHYEFQLTKRDELLFVNDSNGTILDYYDCDF